MLQLRGKGKFGERKGRKDCQLAVNSRTTSQLLHRQVGTRPSPIVHLVKFDVAPNTNIS
jgi:hypothetical protein